MKNAEQIRQVTQAYRHRNRDKIREWERRYREKNRELVRARNRIYQERYRQRHKQKLQLRGSTNLQSKEPRQNQAQTDRKTSPKENKTNSKPTYENY